MEKTLFIPINSASLAHYFSKAIILPAKYFTNKPEDIQNSYNYVILLSAKKWVENSDCVLEVIITDSEQKWLVQASDNFYFYKMSIPISRVKSICFKDVEQKEITLWNINNGAAFIPEFLVSVEQTNTLETISASEITWNEEVLMSSDMSDKIKRFDIILGGFAFMRLGGEPFMNYSPNYFATFAYFNKIVEEQLEKATREKGLRFSNKYIGLFLKSENEWTKWQQYIYKNLEVQDVEVIARKEGERLEKKYGLIKIDSVNPRSHIYELAILATYGDRKNKSTDNLVTDLTNGTIHPEKVEDVSILFGLNSGYSKLRNKYKGSEKDHFVKFTLENKLDYYIIESIFQFAFYGTKPSLTFDIIDTWCPINKKTKTLRAYLTYEILDMTVIAKKKQSILDVFLENYSLNIYSAIYKSINQWLPPFARSDEKQAIEYFDKQLRTVLSDSIEDLQKRIESELEESYNKMTQEAKITYNTEIEKLSIKLTILQNENQKLIDCNKTLADSEQKTIQPKKSYTIKNTDFSEINKGVSVVQEATEGENYGIFDSMNLTKLKKIAKQRGISETTLKGFKKGDEKELINLILKTPEPPTIL